MTEKGEVKPMFKCLPNEKWGKLIESLPDLDDLLQCPVCYEIPSGQIFQCNEGHHVCGRCKLRLDVCPVCRALFFGTRNYAMEELIANVKKLRAFKLGGKVTTGSTSSENTTAPIEESTAETTDNLSEDEENNHNFASRPAYRTPQACKGLFRCLCCKTGNTEKLPAARLLNHLRYFHAPELIEGKSEGGEYLQAWQFSTVPGRLVTAVRIADMGIFFLIIEKSDDSVCAWLTMAASPWVAHEFCYTVTISGNDREAIFSDCVWSVRSCEGSLRRRGHCLAVSGLDARALVADSMLSGKLAVKRVPGDQPAHQTQPRAVLRIASRGNARDPDLNPMVQDLEPFLQDLQNDVARLSRAFVTLGREATALVRSEAQIRARYEHAPRSAGSTNSTRIQAAPSRAGAPPVPPPVAPPVAPPVVPPVAPPVVPPVAPPVARPVPPPAQNEERPHNMSRNARRRMRQRVRAALNDFQLPVVLDRPTQPLQRAQTNNAGAPIRNARAPSPIGRSIEHHFTGFAVVVPAPPQPAPAPAPAPAPSNSGPSNGTPDNNNQQRGNKKRRRQRR